MRLLVVTCALVAASAVLACGGGTPPPSDETAAHGESKPTDSPPAEATGNAPAPAADSTPAPAASSSASASDSSAAPGGADDPWMASHQMTPKDVLHAVRPAQGKAQACFRAGVKRDPSTSGEVKIRFVINNDGIVRVWRDDGSSMTDEAVTECVGQLIKSLKFPKQKSPGDAWGAYTVNFTE
jgi:outer membrane biosynthesis protein TonB